MPLLVVIIASLGYIVGKTVETRHLDSVTISVSGEGKVYANPDIAQMSFGVQTGRQASAEGAMEILTSKMTAVIERLEGLGIEEKDISTQQLSLRPAYDWEEGKRIDRGYEATQNLVVKVRELDELGKVLTAVTSAGANQVGGVSFTIDDPEELREEAREKAIEQAEQKAEELADQLDMRLGSLKGFHEGGGGYEPRYYAKDMAVMESVGTGGGAPAVPVPTGEQEINVSVSLTYELR